MDVSPILTGVQSSSPNACPASTCRHKKRRSSASPGTGNNKSQGSGGLTRACHDALVGFRAPVANLRVNPATVAVRDAAEVAARVDDGTRASAVCDDDGSGPTSDDLVEHGRPACQD